MRIVLSPVRLVARHSVLIEDKASGTQLIQELIAEGCHDRSRRICA
jgi:hypothetical protein